MSSVQLVLNVSPYNWPDAWRAGGDVAAACIRTAVSAFRVGELHVSRTGLRVHVLVPDDTSVASLRERCEDVRTELEGLIRKEIGE